MIYTYNELYILIFQDETMREIVVKWLNEQEIYYDKIIFSPEDKLEDCKKNNIDIMIEDKG